MSDLDLYAPEPFQGVALDDSKRYDRFCAAMVEGASEFDWDEGHDWSLPEALREGLREWAKALYEWDRANRAEKELLP